MVSGINKFNENVGSGPGIFSHFDQALIFQPML